MTKVILFSPLGVAAVNVPNRNGRLRAAAAFGAAVSVLIEAGQLFLSSHTPSMTDALLGGAGAWAGAVAAVRARSGGNATRRADGCCTAS